MASPTFDFDDQLSEDWISQPRSSDGAASPRLDNLRSSALHSRIPLPTKPATASKPVSAAPSSNRPSPRVLHTKSKSELNIPILRKSDTKDNVRPRPPPGASRSQSSQHRRSSSAQSWINDGTVQRVASEVRQPARSGEMTPEWKRRLLKKQEAGEPKDLFSPMGLENVFRPPPTQRGASTAQSPKRIKPRAESSSIYPSSPPPYPSTRRRRAATKSTSPSPLRRHYEHDHNQCLAKGGKCEGALRTPLRTPTPTRRQARVRANKDNSQRHGRDGNSAGQRVQSNTSFAEHESISPVPMQNGQIDYKSVQKSAQQMRKKMDELGLPEQERPSSRSSEHGIDYGSLQRRQALIPELTFTSLVDCLADGSDTRAPAGGFVGTRRGGYSSDDNFHDRHLSPSSFQREDSSLSKKSVLSLDRIHRPATPRRDERFTQSSPEKPRSGGSPLKLFGQHDTFTKNHLMRRLSQYVDDDDRELHESSMTPSPSPKRHADNMRTADSAYVEGFGDGQLDEHRFPPSESFLLDRLHDDDPSLPPVLPPSESLKFQRPVDEPLNSKRRTSRALSKHLANPLSQRFHRRPSLADFRRSIGDAADIRNDGKRVLYSPTRDHQAKRRRTLLSSVGSPDASPEPPLYRLLIGKKRTDARPGELARNASPDVMAGREVLRPRSISSPQLRRSSTSTMSSWLGAASSRQVSGHASAQTNDSVDSPTKMLAEDLASFAVNVAESLANGERKPSVTTADFFKEANMIMRHLRGQPQSSGAPTPTRRTSSGRASGDVSIVDQMSDIEELDEESIRSLRSLQKHRSLRSNLGSLVHSWDADPSGQQHASVKLHKFQEEDDFGLALPASVRNLKIAPEIIHGEDDLPDTDAPNIRILERTTGNVQQAGGEVHTNIRTRSSTDLSMNRSIRTGDSSSNSSRKYNIAPDTVRDLLSDHVGQMVFDHVKGLWVRNRSGSTDHRPGSSHLHSDGTEEDPLKGIPDLEDDELPRHSPTRTERVTQRVSSTGTVINKTADSRSPKLFTAVPCSGQNTQPRSRPSSGHGADSSTLSRFSKFGSSQPAPETRATSWSTAPPTKSQTVAVEPDLPQVDEAGETTDEQQIGEQPILEMISETPIKQSGYAAQQQSFAQFSSPFSQLPDHVLFPSSSKKITGFSSDGAADCTPSMPETPMQRSQIASALLRSKQQARHHLSVVKQRYSDRPVSRIDEQDEETQSRHTPETSLALVTPRALQQRQGDIRRAALSPSTRHTSVAFHRSLRLDPLSDFTIHQADESLHLDIDYVKKRHGLATHTEIDSRFSLAVRDLVACITDIEPYEPYWEYIRQLNLSHKKLLTLHTLEDFCERIEELQVDHNELGQVNGAPQLLRMLSISHNCLTSMTAWGHLRNLHYLDVSNNQIDSLTAFAALPHLRELRADGNRLTSLDGLSDCPSLLKLSLRDNLIASADLSECQPSRLTELDVTGNRIPNMPGLGRLSSLQILRLSGNQLCSLPGGDLPSDLIELDLADNLLSELDVSLLTHLQILNVDGNCLSQILGFSQVKGLETLSWKNQNLPDETAIIFEQASDVRHLALSGNKLDLTKSKTQFLNLNTLEMANCGIEVLPMRFGRSMPNLRYLDLNNNAIKDVKPLTGIRRLRELHLVENRLHRLRNTATLLEKIGGELQIVDLRWNPITLGFHPSCATPATTLRALPKANIVAKQLRSAEQYTAWAIGLKDKVFPAIKAPHDDEFSQEQDRLHKARLAEGTALRRRVFELLLCSGCPALAVINGLSVDESILGEKDQAWERLVELKVIRPDGRENESNEVH